MSKLKLVLVLSYCFHYGFYWRLRLSLVVEMAAAIAAVAPHTLKAYIVRLN
jgi:hypothetical protein